MKQAFTIIMLCLPLFMEGRPVKRCEPLQERTETHFQKDTIRTQDTKNNADWAIPDQQNTPAETTGANTEVNGNPKKRPQQPIKLKEDPKYLEGAVPTDKNGKIIFTLDKEIPGHSKKEVYDSLYQYLDQLTKGKDELKDSRIALVSTSRGIIAAVVKEWMTFKSSFLSLDRTKFLYTIIAQCSDNHLKVTISRISYVYEEGRAGGFNSPAEEIISDKYALTKKKNDLTKIYGKFRKETIDRKDEIFKQIVNLFQKQKKE